MPFCLSGDNFIFSLFPRCWLATVYHAFPWGLQPANSLKHEQNLLRFVLLAIHLAYLKHIKASASLDDLKVDETETGSF